MNSFYGKRGLVGMVLVMALFSYWLWLPEAAGAATACTNASGCADPLYKCVNGQCDCRWGNLYQSWDVVGLGEPTTDLCVIIRTYVAQGSSEGAAAALAPFVGFLAVTLTGVIVMIGLIMIVFGGYLYMTAGGSADRIQQAKAWIMAALIGIIIAVAALTILSVINESLV